MMLATWVIDKDKIYCQGGLPHQFMISHKHHSIIFCVQSPNQEKYHAIKKTQAGLSLDFTKGEFISYRYLVGHLTMQVACVLSSLIQKMYWQAECCFCSRCGTPFGETVVHYGKTCPLCEYVSYPKVQPCVIVAITRHCQFTDKPQILLAKHHRHSHENMYGLLAGFVEIGETLEMAVAREVFEETNLTIKNLQYAGSQPWPYPSNLMIGFTAEYHQGHIQIQADELADARFFNIDNLPIIPPKGTIAHQLIGQTVAKFTP